MEGKPGEAGSDLPGRADLIGQPLAPSQDVLDQVGAAARGTSLHAGELETIAAVKDFGRGQPDYDIIAVIDDRAARKFAGSQGLHQGDQLVGSLGLLARIHERGWQVPGTSFRQDVDRLVAAGARLNANLIDGVVRQFEKERLQSVLPQEHAQASPSGPQAPSQTGHKEPEPEIGL